MAGLRLDRPGLCASAALTHPSGICRCPQRKSEIRNGLMKMQQTCTQN